ncbi:reverse transcriptase domain-containing protein, partial [Tanacetum coccineum]
KAHTDVFAWTTAHMTGVPRVIMVGGEIFNTKHRVNESKHVEPVKQKKRSLAPERNEVIHTQVEELKKANILREAKYQTWVSNPFFAKKADGRWKLHRATYQKLIDKVFSCQVGRNMEVNADEMVIKSDSEEEMLADIKETLERLRVINLKLNPKKCSFGVEEGRFSGHLITKQGIKADPSKVKAISDLQPPKSVSEIQSLGKNMSGKMVQWTTEVDEAFRRMKELLEALPTVTHQTNAKESVSEVFNAEEGKSKFLCYCSSTRILHGDCVDIPGNWKSHAGPRIFDRKKAAMIFSSSPIRNSRKIETINIGEAKRKEPEPKNAWELFTDRASSFDGSGAGLMMVNPKGKEYTYALRFEFETTNNEAEYEALLAGLRIAKEMKIQELIIFVDKRDIQEKSCKKKTKTTNPKHGSGKCRQSPTSKSKVCVKMKKKNSIEG